MRRLLPGRPSAFLLRLALLAIPLLAGSGSAPADAQTVTCYDTVCTTLSDGSIVCVSKQKACPLTNT
jgi:hypothetical protein